MQITVTIDETVYRKALWEGLKKDYPDVQKDFSPETLPIMNNGSNDVAIAMRNLTEFDFEVEIRE